ncbi:MAG TPA: DNA gyrase modulator, partial [Jiangellaceae bacterium]|nr:DNA gyrase modulator [Jiangellaceae bacterium]
MPQQIDAVFLALPMRTLADAALERAQELGAEHADFRLERIRGQHLSLRDGRLEGTHDGEDVGFGVRVVH